LGVENERRILMAQPGKVQSGKAPKTGGKTLGGSKTTAGSRTQTGSKVVKGSSKVIASHGSRHGAPVAAVHKQVFKIDCSNPASDGIFDEEILKSFELFLIDRIKVDGKTGRLGDKVKISLEDNCINVTTYIHFSKRYLKYLSKRFLNKHRLRDWIRVVSTKKNVYELKYFSIRDEADEAGEA